MSLDSYSWDTEWAGDIAQATVDYDVTEPGHLSFIEGELLRVLERKTDGWWRGEANGVTGIFYRTFVVELERESSTSVPINFKQVAFIGKPKQSFLARKKSEDIPSPSEKKLSSLRSISRQESGDSQKTPDLKKKMSHISISLETETSPDKSTSKQESLPASVTPDTAAILERASSYIRDKDNSYERKLSNRLNSINIEELIDQLVEYSGFEVPPTPDIPQFNQVVSVTNIGFEPESPNKKDNATKVPDLFSTITTSLVNTNLDMGEDLYDSLDGVEKSTESAHTPENISEENPLYEKLGLQDTAESINTHEQTSDVLPLSDTPFRPPIPTSSRPTKPVPPDIPPPPSSSLASKPAKASGKKFSLGGQKGDKPEKDKNKPKSQARPKRVIFGRRQKFSVDSLLDGPSRICPDSPLPCIPTDTLFNSDNSSANNSNPVPIGEYSTLQVSEQSGLASCIYEQVDRESKPVEISGSSQNENIIRPLLAPASVNARTSHYEVVDLIPQPPHSSKNQSAVQEEPDDLYSQVDFVKKNFKKTASLEEHLKFPLSGDELSSTEFGHGSETHNVIRSKSNSGSDDKLDEAKSYHIYSLVTRKRDSVIIQDDEGDVCVSISPDKEHGPAFEPEIDNSEPLPKTLPILPPKIFSVEDVEIYIKEEDIGLGEVLLSPVDKFLPTCRTSPGGKKRVSHYQDINDPGSPILPARMLSDDEFYEEVSGRFRASSVPQCYSTAEAVKTTLEIRHSAEHVQRKVIIIDQNLTPLPPIPVNTQIQTMDEDLSQYYSLESVMGARAPNKFPDKVQAINDNPLPPPPVDLRTQYIESLLACVSILLQSTDISYSLFTKDNSQHTKKLIKSIEQGQPLSVDYRTPPAILASLIRLILKNGKLGPIFSISVTDTLLVLVKNDKPQPILHEIYTIQGLSKFIRDFIYLLYLNFSGMNDKKKLEFITTFSGLFFEDTSKKNIDNCRHILRFLIERYPSIFQI